MQSYEVAEARRVSGFRLELERPLAELVLAEHPPEEVHTPHLIAHLWKPELRERDAHLHDPAERIDGRRYVPHRVPGAVSDEEIVAAEVIQLHAGGIDRELERRPMIVVAVEVDVEHVALRIVVAAPE